MQYMILIHSDEQAWAKMPQDQIKAVYGETIAYSRELVEAGVMRGGSELAPSMSATTLSARFPRTAPRSTPPRRSITDNRQPFQNVNCPPSTTSAWPVTKAASSEARKATTAATSSGVPKRAIGILSRR